MTSSKYTISEDGSDWRGRWLNAFMISTIWANLIVVILGTVGPLAANHGVFFRDFELFLVAVFSIEYILRLWLVAKGKDERFRHPVAGRIRYALTPMALVDAIAILPFYLGIFIPIDSRAMLLFRLMRFLKLTRYSSALNILGSAVYSQRKALGATLVIILTLLVFSSSVVYLLEKDTQPEVFASIPQAMWWGMATLTTVGYGDVTPISAAGKVFGAFIMFLGVGMIALPTGILANAFASELRKHEFVANWNMVASVPLFAGLDALSISEIVGMLELKITPPNYTIIERGDRADAMYFISLGEVEVKVKPEPLRLKAGDFFGEIALLKESTRTATVISVTECQLMVLSSDALKRLIRDNPELYKTLDEIMKQRIAELEKTESA